MQTDKIQWWGTTGDQNRKARITLNGFKTLFTVNRQTENNTSSLNNTY